MTQINRITIAGFKSFAHKTDIPFDDRFNCILGPNGSGKSNIGDALCFVLGRLSAKSMRAEKASNLIFNGGKNKKPAATGTVEIVFSNDDAQFPVAEKEVVVNRTIQKNGNSIYKVNDKKMTRSEVVDLLGLAKINPEGYNIILQGDITRFVTMSPVERRKIIEEISDVAVYEEKKHKALLELSKVEEKLNNAEIILKERKTYLKELKKDRDQALEFKEVQDKIDSHKATFVHLQMQSKNVEKVKLEEKIKGFQTKIDEADTKIKTFKEAIVQHRNEISRINQEIEQKGEKEQVQVHRQIEDLKVELAKNKTRISTLKDEITKIGGRKEQFKQELVDLADKVKGYATREDSWKKELHHKKAELDDTTTKIAEFKKKNKIESSAEIEKDIESKDTLIEEKQEEVQKVRVLQQELLREKDKVEFQLQTIDEKIKKVKEVEGELKEQLKGLQTLKGEFKGATLKLSSCLDQDSSFASQVANARRMLVDLQEKQAKLNAKTLSIKASMASNQALRAILDNKTKFKGVHGTVAELGQVDKKYAQAVEAAAGARMEYLVVDDDAVAAECIAYLKNAKLGTASFIPLNKIRTQEITSEDKKLLKAEGVHNFALNLVTFKAAYAKAFSYVFGNTLVVEDLSQARRVGIGRIKMVTLDGGIAESSGVMKGGFLARKNATGFAEKDSLEELEKLEGDISEHQGVITNLEVKREANQKEISFLRNRKSELEGEIIKLEKSLHLETGDLEATGQFKTELQAKLKTCEESLLKVNRDVMMINKDLATLKSDKQVLRTEVSELRNPRLLAQLSAYEELRQKIRDEIIHLEGDLKNSSGQVEQLLAPERAKIQEILKQHEKEESTFTSEISKLTTLVVTQEKDLKIREKESEEFYSKYKELFATREKLAAAIQKAEHEMEVLREKSRDNEKEINLVSLHNAEIKAKLAGLEEEFSRYKNASILEHKTVEELKSEIGKFEVILSGMSAVNMKALEIYEQVEKEYNSLVEKREQLVSEKTEVMTLMNEIETKKKENFMKTFTQANDNFTRIFSTLFKKGSAYLELENPAQPFEEGLTIKVKITGNRYMDIKSLSGGEKTLTALSFIFAIQEYQPASFYILDEIDAALDKHNAEMLAKLIRSYSERAQYVVISHNDAVISEADTLFGVSMVDGVSKVTSLKI